MSQWKYREIKAQVQKYRTCKALQQGLLKGITNAAIA